MTRWQDETGRLDPNCSRLRPLAEYARRLPSRRPGRRLNRATLWRWALRGVRGGRRLRTAELGGSRVTCDAWVWEFVAPRIVPGQAVDSTARLDPDTRARIGRALGGIRASPGTRDVTDV